MNLEPLAISEILDKQFFIPDYQRGYRWTPQQVMQLLDDIDSFFPREIEGKPNQKTFYCLQPVVVKLISDEKKGSVKQEKGIELEGDWYEVVDGQQRLTTIYLILQYINQKWLGEDKLEQFKISYETRPESIKFLKELKVNPDDTVDINKDNIDFYYMSKSLQTIRSWQLDYKESNKTDLNKADFQSKFIASAKIIWYQVDNENNKSHKLFERLNLGKIPLTNAELTKALFLSSESFKNYNFTQEEKQIKKITISQLWDEMEHKLNDPDLKFWSFITNKKRDQYETKIDLILDLIAGKNDHEKDPLFTFLYFLQKQKDEGLEKVWEEIEQFYNTVSEWLRDRDYYHKIGYLVTSKRFKGYEGVNLGYLVKLSMKITKTDFINNIDGLIRDSIKSEISELRYKPDYPIIFNLLLLFNIEINRRSAAITEYYPFKQHKDNNWSLEHIHARKNRINPTKKDVWLEWIKLHMPLVKEMLKTTENKEMTSKINEVLETIEKYNNESITWDRFKIIFQEVNDVFTIDHKLIDEDTDGVRNLALLSQPDNAALNDSVFEVKRREIISLDKEGSFIPICTKRVFMKYFHDDGFSQQFYFWGPKDRAKYYENILDVLDEYITKNHIEKEETDEND